MNPLRWVRWKVVGVLAVLGLAVYFLGLDKMALGQINAAGKESASARWSIAGFALGILGGDAELRDLILAPVAKAKASATSTGAGGAEEKVFNAAGVKADLSMLSLLEGRCVVDEVVLDAPQLLLARRPDGSVNVEDVGPPVEEGPATTVGDVKGWVDSLKKWHDRIQKIREKLPRKGERKPAEKKGTGVDYSRAATYPFEGRPAFLVRELRSENLDVRFSDASSPQPIPPLEKGVLRVSNLSSSPTTQDEPTTFQIAGAIAGSPLLIEGTLDFRGDRSLISFKIDTGDLPASLVEAFAGPSLPVRLKAGTVGLKAILSLDGADGLLVDPRLSFKKLALEPKDPSGRIAGLKASEFASAFNDASSEMDEVVIDDLKIRGTLGAPQFEWGDTVKNLVVSGGKAFARKEAQKGLDQGKALLEKNLEKLPLPGGAAQVKDALKNLDAKALEGGLKGFFGGGKEAVAPPKKD
jgi:hypothetical protein